MINAAITPRAFASKIIRERLNSPAVAVIRSQDQYHQMMIPRWRERVTTILHNFPITRAAGFVHPIHQDDQWLFHCPPKELKR